MKKYFAILFFQKTLLLFLALLVSFSWSKEKQEVEVPINIGVGPAFFWIPGVVGRELHTGAKFDLYAVITPKMLQEHENKIPKKYKKYVNMEEEMHISQLWMIILPKYLIISPPGEEKSYIYGGLWSFLSLSENFLNNKYAELELELVLPTISYIYASDKKNKPDGQHLWGIGTMLRLSNTVKFSESFLATLAYGHNFNLPLQYFGVSPPNNGYQEEGESTRRQWIQTGVLSLVFHFRFLSIKQKI
ncbi:hypothetical protein R83H12_01174 [Fibrobacteria bacterium R8-3-H12]